MAAMMMRAQGVPSSRPRLRGGEAQAGGKNAKKRARRTLAAEFRLVEALDAVACAQKEIVIRRMAVQFLPPENAGKGAGQAAFGRAIFTAIGRQAGGADAGRPPLPLVATGHRPEGPRRWPKSDGCSGGYNGRKRCEAVSTRSTTSACLAAAGPIKAGCGRGRRRWRGDRARRKGGGREAGARLLVMEVEGWKSCPVFTPVAEAMFHQRRCGAHPDGAGEHQDSAPVRQLVLHALSVF